MNPQSIQICNLVIFELKTPVGMFSSLCFLGGILSSASNSSEEDQNPLLHSVPLMEHVAGALNLSVVLGFWVFKFHFLMCIMSGCLMPGDC